MAKILQQYQLHNNVTVNIFSCHLINLLHMHFSSVPDNTEVAVITFIIIFFILFSNNHLSCKWAAVPLIKEMLGVCKIEI